MPTLEQVNKEISSYKTSDYNWVRELTTLFEIYFDKEFRWFLTEHRGVGMTEAEFKEIFIYSLDTLYSIINNNNYYVGDDEHSLGLYFFNLQHPTRNKELQLNKERAEKLFIRVTMPFRIFEMNISKHLIKYYEAMRDAQESDQEKRSLEIKIAGLKGSYETSEKNFNKLAEDMQKDRRESIDRMPLTYIDACERYATDKPTLTQLSYISAVPEEVWKKALANSIFLLFLAEKLKDKWKQAKEKREFWWGAYNVIDLKYSEVKKRLKFKTSQLSEDKDPNKLKTESKQSRIKAATIKADKEIGTPQEDEIKECEICGVEAKYGNLCKDCNKAFKVKKGDKIQKKTKKEIENDERIKKTIAEFTKKKDGNQIAIDNQTAK